MEPTKHSRTIEECGCELEQTSDICITRYVHPECKYHWPMTVDEVVSERLQPRPYELDALTEWELVNLKDKRPDLEKEIDSELNARHDDKLKAAGF